MFSWLKMPQDAPAAHLRNCMLHFQIGKHARVLALVAPRDTTPLKLELAKTTASKRLYVTDPPESSAMRLVVRSQEKSREN